MHADDKLFRAVTAPDGSKLPGFTVFHVAGYCLSSIPNDAVYGLLVGVLIGRRMGSGLGRTADLSGLMSKMMGAKVRISGPMSDE